MKKTPKVEKNKQKGLRDGMLPSVCAATIAAI